MDNWDNNNNYNFVMVDSPDSGDSPNSDSASSEAGAESTYTADFPNSGKKKKKKEKKPKVPMQITRKGFVLTLILCMLITSVVSAGGFYAITSYLGYGSGNGGSATNYTLTTSEETLSYESIITKNENAVVSITTESVSTDNWAQNYVTEGAGSGVIIDSSGYIMTCNHVISGASKITVTLKNEEEYTASVVGSNSKNDIAVLKINAKNLTAATYGDSSKLSVGSAVVAIGNPLGELGGTATTGIISALDRELTIENQTMNLLQTDASINPGNSGGGLFDAGGNLVGIVVAKSSGSDVEGLGFAIPINTAAEIAKDLIENGSSSEGVGIGVSVTDIDAEAAQSYGLRMTGVYISKVTSSEAKKAGFESGDMIYYIEDTEITSTSDLSSALNKHKAGDKVKVTIIRDNKTMELTTTLIELTS